MDMKRGLLYIAAVILVIGGIISSGVLGLNWNSIQKSIPFSMNLPRLGNGSALSLPGSENTRVVNEESVVIDAVDKVSPSVVTIGITATRRSGRVFEINPFDPFSPFRQSPGREQTVEQDIGSGFIIAADGLIVTNKHVVSESDATYRVITQDDTSHDVTNIYRDPVNDLAILKINTTGLKPAELGDSDKIRVGQLAIAIGTALGEFRQTVTTGVISGVGRGITAGSPFEGYVEELDGVIQTDAAINPGNSGGPLLNSSGQVIGVNTAVSAQGENIGFALPINVVKEALENFNTTGQFNRPYLGVRYRTVSRDLSVLNDIPEGAYIMEVIEGSPAASAGLTEGDIITHMDGTRLTGDNSELSALIGKRKVGDKMTLNIWRDGEEKTITVTLANQSQ